MWVLVTKNAAAKPLSHHFAALWEPIWGLCGFIGQSLEEFFSETQKALWRCQREGCRYNPRSCFFFALNSSSVIIPMSRRVASCSSSSRGEMSLEDRDGDPIDG